MLALSLLLATSTANAETTTPATTVTMPVSSGCAVVYSQGEVQVCIPELSRLDMSFGYVVASWKTPTAIEFTLGATGANETIAVQIELYDENMTRIYSGSIIINKGEVRTYEYQVPENIKALVYKIRVGSEESAGALLVPKTLQLPVPREYAENPLVLLLLGLIPVSLILGYFLTTDLRDAAVLAFASLSSVYILISFIMPPSGTPWITILLALALLFTIAYYVVAR